MLAVVVGMSAGATIAIDLAVRRPDLVQAVITHEAAWRASRHLPNTSQLAAVAKIGWEALRGRDGDASETLLRAAYTYDDGGTAWDAFPQEWRRIARETLGQPCWTSETPPATIHQRPISPMARSPVVQLRRPQPRRISAPHAPSRRPSPPRQFMKLKEPATPPSSMQHPIVQLITGTITSEQRWTFGR